MLSREFLLERGYCCGLGCLMCPYHPKHEKSDMRYKPLHDSLTIKKSLISGLGVFACKAIPKDIDLGITHIANTIVGYHFPQNVIRTPLGGFLNHSNTPNCYIEQEGQIWYLLTQDVIPSDTELTIKYFPEFLNF